MLVGVGVASRQHSESGAVGRFVGAAVLLVGCCAIASLPADSF